MQMVNHPNRSKKSAAGWARLPVVPTPEIIDILDDAETPYGWRLNKMNKRGEEYEVYFSPNEDWREVVPYEHEIVGRFATEDGAVAMHADLAAAWRWKQIIGTVSSPSPGKE